ncbi:MAG: hypothetical protein HY537_06880 [Deltaproteobacteria bacterium]|nr:hypothetical protein [Deltaproteobacteria bacterium]
MFLLDISLVARDWVVALTTRPMVIVWDAGNQDAALITFRLGTNLVAPDRVAAPIM